MSSDQQTPTHSHENPSPILQIAINKFNAGDYFSCHEFLEELWLEEQTPKRELYKGILQIGIGLRHLQRDNINGARRLLENGIMLLQPFSPTCFGIDILRLQRDARTVLHRLKEPNPPHPFMESDAIQIQTR
jgi:hypothetical protein